MSALRGDSFLCPSLKRVIASSLHAVMTEVRTRRRKRCLVYFFTFLFAFGTAPGQQEPVTFTSNTTLVIIDVSVKDKDGKIIENLKKNDFTLTEDGKQQQIAVFDFQKLDNQNLAPVPAVKGDRPLRRIKAKASWRSAEPSSRPRNFGGAAG